jgi:hypothetical protein
LQAADFDQICRSWYTNPNAFAIRDQNKPTQAYNWSCYEVTAQDVASLATPSVLTLRIDGTRDWVAFSNVSASPLTLAFFSLQREGRIMDASAWGRAVLSPGECLMIHKSDELPNPLPPTCMLPISLPAAKEEREFWLNGEVIVYVNPSAQYTYSPDQ